MASRASVAERQAPKRRLRRSEGLCPALRYRTSSASLVLIKEYSQVLFQQVMVAQDFSVQQQVKDTIRRW